MTSGLELPRLSNHRLEWTDWWDAGPHEWEMLSPKYTEQMEETEEAPGWYMEGFQKSHEGGDPADFYFNGWCDRDEERGVARYEAEIYIPILDEYGTLECYVREVPGPLIFKCALSMDHALQVFGVAFTTLAGREIFRVAQKSLPSSLTMRDLIAMATDAAKIDGLLRSRNQEVHVLLDGYTDTAPLCPETVLWCKHLPRLGLLQFS